MADSENTVVVTDENFEDAVEGASLAIVDFWAEWCGPCRIVGPVIDQLAEQYADRGVVVGKVDVDHNPGVSQRFGIRSIPSILFFKDGQHVDTVLGAVPKPHLERKLLELL